jgi:hypothetical protein
MLKFFVAAPDQGSGIRCPILTLDPGSETKKSYPGYTSRIRIRKDAVLRFVSRTLLSEGRREALLYALFQCVPVYMYCRYSIIYLSPVNRYFLAAIPFPCVAG